MMHIRKLLALALLGLSLSAAAGFTTITEAYEVAVSDLRLPGHISGTLGFKQCSECETQTLSVTSSTHYVLDGHAVTLNEFEAQLGGVGNPSDVFATVFHHLESNVITGINVRL